MQVIKDKDVVEGNQLETISNVLGNIEEMGILRNKKGIDSLNYGKIKAKRGRKSLEVLREDDR